MITSSSSTVCAVVPTRDNFGQLQECLASLAAQTTGLHRVCVCVDGSTDGTLEYLAGQSLPSNVRTLVHNQNTHRGRAATRNLAMAHLDADYVWFVDSDMRARPDALARHLDAAREATISVGSIVYENADEDAWAGYLATRGRNRYAHGVRLPFTQFTTANSLVPAAMVRGLAGFDERFAGYGGEDLDFAMRLESRYDVRFLNNRAAVVCTAEHKTVDQALAQFEHYGAGNLRLLEALHPDAPRTFALERLGSPKLVDRLFAACMNPLTDALAHTAVRRGPGAIRNHALNYMVIRAVWRGYREPTPSG